MCSWKLGAETFRSERNYEIPNIVNWTIVEIRQDHGILIERLIKC